MGKSLENIQRKTTKMRSLQHYQVQCQKHWLYASSYTVLLKFMLRRVWCQNSRSERSKSTREGVKTNICKINRSWKHWKHLPLSCPKRNVRVWRTVILKADKQNCECLKNVNLAGIKLEQYKYNILPGKWMSFCWGTFPQTRESGETSPKNCGSRRSVFTFSPFICDYLLQCAEVHSC